MPILLLSRHLGGFLAERAQGRCMATLGLLLGGHASPLIRQLEPGGTR